MTTPAEIRRRRDSRRIVGIWMIVVGVFAVLIAIVAAILDVGLIGVGPVYFASCGAPLFPVPQVGAAAAACALAFGEQITFAVVVGLAGALVAAGGAIIAWRNAL